MRITRQIAQGAAAPDTKREAAREQPRRQFMRRPSSAFLCGAVVFAKNRELRRARDRLLEAVEHVQLPAFHVDLQRINLLDAFTLSEVVAALQLRRYRTNAAVLL